MTEFSSSIVHDLMVETRLLPPTVKALREKGLGWTGVAGFISRRLFSGEAYDPERPIWISPEHIPLFSRREIILYRELFLFDDYEMVLWRDDFSRAANPVVLDVGANAGLFAALCVRINPFAQMHCIEMIPDCKPAIERRLRAMGCGDFEVITAAAGRGIRDTVEVNYDLPFSMGNTLAKRDGLHRVVVDELSIDAWYERHKDAVSTPLFLVKIDVEGAERDVVEGGMECLTAADYILLEIHSPRDRELSACFGATHQVLSDKKKSDDFSVCVPKKKGR